MTTPSELTLSSLRLVRYAPGWGHTPIDFERTLEAGETVALKHTSHPVTADRYVSVYRTRLILPAASKRSGEPTAISAVVKITPLPTLRDRARSLLKHTKHHRQWRGHDLLSAAGVPSSRPLAILRAHTELGEAEIMILEHLEGRTLLERFVEYQDGLPMPPHIGPALAQTIARLVRHRLWNRDPKPSNILTHDPGPGGLGITLLDTVGLERRAARKNAFLRHVVGLLLLETRGSGVPLPPEFAAQIVASTLGADISSQSVSDLLGEVERGIADDQGTPTDTPIPPPSTNHNP